MTDPASRTTLDAELQAAFETPYTFDPPESAVPPEMRPEWRIPVLLLLLRKCRGQRATWRQLHVLNWAIRNPSSQQVILDVLEGRLTPDRALVRFEPGLSHAVDLARGAGLIEWRGGRVAHLTTAGKQAVQAIEDSGTLTDERAFLDRIAGPVSQKWIDELIEGSSV